MNQLSGLVGEWGANGFTTANDPKVKFFNTGIPYMIPEGLPEEIKKQWREEYNLCNCHECADMDCKHRLKTSRFPIDAGGGNQCLRLMKTKSRFVWRNGNGTVIEIPQEIIQEIIGELEND